MRAVMQFSVTLPDELGRLVKEKVRSGVYASESEVIRDGLRALMARDVAQEQWLRTEGVARYDASVADPARALSADEAWSSLEDHMKHRRKQAR
ncbi:type II toxin-antitoxin system ParD family antitoxin [Reyranella sp. CPCC 100927]|uniref:ribbon-helix-helix domain-containing protein n=1 Tax=Reyranella sp. CPCC 100927 TaxID=2599616 RepID=UPI0011B6A49D|nr:type II toxin-antitoxin system ParD family antitoxin [Reyranella sp. CPCC 100927]TWS95950.1 type II toxin-antitoxin system ParD family antitoxin [Reyranella sp. CPCC 100927]